VEKMRVSNEKEKREREREIRVYETRRVSICAPVGGFVVPFLFLV